MVREEELFAITNLSEEISKLPKGYISKKIVRGKTYYYHQWSENGKKKSGYLRDDEVAGLSAKLERRKELQKELNDLKSSKTSSGSTNIKERESSCLKCTLMHSDMEVADIQIDEASGWIQKIENVYSPKHLPLGIQIRHDIVDRAALNEWWSDRAIPASRSGIHEALEKLEITTTKALLIRCYGLSLSDQYWIRPAGTNLNWKQINFFDNDFSDDVGDVLFGSNKNPKTLNFSSPDNTSDGNLKKRWKIIDGKRCLIKGGSNPFRQQPLNEVVASEIMDLIGIPHVPYTVVWHKGSPYSVCEDFLTRDTELIPAWRIIQIEKKPNNISVYRHFVNCAEKLGIKNVTVSLDQMITIDFIIANEDRHLNNFGAIRNAKTLEWLGFAPIYDSGSSLGYDKLVPQIFSEDEVVCKPFKNHHIEQLKLVSSFDWLDVDKLGDIGQIIRNVLMTEEAEEYVNKNRIEAIIDSVERRIKYLKSFIVSDRKTDLEMTNDDVSKNIAEDYINDKL